MTEEEFRADLLAAVASRAEVEACGTREAFSLEMLDRLSASGEVPDAEACVEVLTGQRGRKLEIDAWGTDDADGSLHLFVVILDGGANYPPSITLTDARDQGFSTCAITTSPVSAHYAHIRLPHRCAMSHPGLSKRLKY